ncbi:MAG: hypothetical protein ABIF92_01910 [archaeon]
MSKEDSWIRRIMKDPKKREKFFLFMTFAPMLVSFLVIIGFIVLILKLVGVF